MLNTDPMNGGGVYKVGSCFEHYTGFHGQRTQQWGYETTQVLSSDTSNVPSDGLYKYNTRTDLLSQTSPDSQFSVPIQTGVPVLTVVSICRRISSNFQSISLMTLCQDRNHWNEH
jgi:hypothetical protein